MAVIQSFIELEEHLRDQIQFLQSSSFAYDNGFSGEAKRLAAVIRVLVHDTNKSTSLLTLLNSKNIYFFNTAIPYNPRNLMVHTGLTAMRTSTDNINSQSEYVAPLDDLSDLRKQRPWVTFDTWWNELVINDHINQFTRKDLVLNVANKDGGAHVDPKLNDSYANLTRNNSIGWYHIDSHGNSKPVKGLELASIRQIAYEMLRTLKNRFPDFF